MAVRRAFGRKITFYNVSFKTESGDPADPISMMLLNQRLCPWLRIVNE